MEEVYVGSISDLGTVEKEGFESEIEDIFDCLSSFGKELQQSLGAATERKKPLLRSFCCGI